MPTLEPQTLDAERGRDVPVTRSPRRRAGRKLPRWLIAARLGTWLLIVASFVGILAFAAFALDSWVVLGAEVLPGVRVGDLDVGGVDATEVRGQLEARAAELSSRPLDYTVDDQSGSLAPASLGFTIDVDATYAAVLAAGRDGGIWSRFTSWLGARFGSGPRLDWAARLDDAAAGAWLDGLTFGTEAAPVEPVVTFEGTAPKVTPGTDGTGIQHEAARGALLEGFTDSERATVALPVGAVPPRHSDEDAARAGEHVAQRMLHAPVTVVLGDRSVEVTAEEVASTLKSAPQPEGYWINVDQARVVEVLRPKFADVGTPPVDARFEVVGATVQIVPGKDGVGCCGKDTAQRLQTAALATDPAQRTITLQTGKVPPATDSADLKALGVTTRLGEFTTEHPDGQPRVLNIHKIADLMRGRLVMPGERFSINETVGERTEEGGWVMAPSIHAGEHVKTPGGGISQFATTLYNAVYFAGIKIEEHQPHTEYFDRYPKGREATLGWPKPDVVFTNDTPGPVLIWTAYNDTSITVSVWGTADGRTVEARGPDVSPQGGDCELVRTMRVITYADGRKVEEPFNQTYCG